MNRHRLTWVALGFCLAVQIDGRAEANEGQEILQVVAGMDEAWNEQQLETCLSYFAQDIDFENSFGWSIRDRVSLERFLEWLFARYPKQAGDAGNEVTTKSSLAMLSIDLAMVDSIKTIGRHDGESPQRSIRSTHILRQDAGKWLVWKTRIWEVRSSDAAPIDLVAPSRFSEESND